MGGHYPTARRASPRPSDFPRTAPGLPANDNRPLRSLPKPANDNWGKPQHSPAPRWERGSALKWALRLGAALTAYEVFDGWYRWKPEQAASTDYSGWTEYMNCYPKARGPYGQKKNFGLSCGGNSSALEWQEGTAYGPELVNAGTAHRYYIMYLADPVTVGGGVHSGKTAAALHQEVPIGDPYILPQPVPRVAPAYQPVVQPRVHPALDPFSLPIGRPVPTPRPLPRPAIPHLRPHPWRSPSEQTQRGPHARRGPRVRSFPGNITAKFMPNGRILVKASPNTTHRNRPPRPKEREKKGKGNPTGPLGTALNWATEGLDILDAAYDALAPYAKAREGLFKKGKPPTPIEKARAIANNLGAVDGARMMENLLRNQANDALAGGLGRAAGKAAGKTYGPGGAGPFGRPAGFQSGPAL